MGTAGAHVPSDRGAAAEGEAADAPRRSGAARQRPPPRPGGSGSGGCGRARRTSPPGGGGGFGATVQGLSIVKPPYGVSSRSTSTRAS